MSNKRKSNVVELARVVNTSLVFSQNNLYMVLKQRLPTDLFKFIKIRFTDVDTKEGILNLEAVTLSKNITQILVQMNTILPVLFVSEEAKPDGLGHHAVAAASEGADRR